ncbi:MAG: Coenzyme F420 hydrogenase/dehydrogenase, beta subunit C-terminal domain [Bacteroides sp.]|uniref:Coenzyme F420 hydrogenase/dehydrogenase, beta subunit C-terminal domain n=1 Tax=Bacteroides sp. TaxID=29523 RepID=UPI002FC990AC
MIELADKDRCTGCGACEFACFKHCIVMEENNMGVTLPRINDSLCVECEKCRKVCPALNTVQGQKPLKAFAARSNDSEVSRTSASGGIAAEIYRDAIHNGLYIVGAAQKNDFSVSLEIASDSDGISRFKNSKYVFSSANSLYPKLKDLLKQEEKVIVVGLPCQIAAIKNLFGNHPNLFLVDIVCHGTTPHRYLKQHIRKIEKSTKKKASRCLFRDPEAYTHTFTFSLYDSDGYRFYSKRTKDGDTYQYGYHRWISYRENCYHCSFACKERLGDISLADYPGLGRKEPFPYSRKNISCVLANTDRGVRLLERLIQAGSIFAIERPLQEAIEYNSQLRRPTPKIRLRSVFEKQMKANGYNFEKSMKPIMRRGLLNEKLKKVSQFPLRTIRKIRRILSSIIQQ